MKTGCIYRIINTITGKSYVGQTTQKLQHRIRGHFTEVRCPRLSASIHKHGKDAFRVEILEDNIPVHYLSDREIYWIAHFDCVTPNGYNLTHGGEERKIISEETRRKLSEATKRNGHKPPSRKGKIPWNKGKKGQQTAWNKGKKTPEETIRKLSEAHKGNIPSLETRRKMSQAHKGKPRSEETRLQISESLKGEKNPNYGKTFSPETRRRMSEAAKRRHTK